MNEKTEQEREAFEAWHTGKYGKVYTEWDECHGRYAWDLTEELWTAWKAALAASPSSKSTKELSDEEVVALCKSAGIGWCEPDEDPEGFPGSFDMATMSEMRALLALASSSIKEDGERAEPVAEVVSWTNGSYSRNYKLRWLKDVPEGTKLYASPPSPLGDTPDQQEKKQTTPKPDHRAAAEIHGCDVTKFSSRQCVHGTYGCTAAHSGDTPEQQEQKHGD